MTRAATHLLRAERLLAERARRLAREKDAEADSRAEVEWLTFSISEQLFGIPLAQGEGVAQLGRLIAVPGAPSYIPGLVRMHGRFIVLVELRQLLLADRRGISDATKVVAVRAANRIVGLAASNVLDVVAVAEAEFAAARVAADGLSRAVTIGAESVGLIDTHALVHDPRLTAILKVDQAGRLSTPGGG